MTDTLLVDRCRQGQEEASRELFRLYQKRVHATLFRILGASSEMDDLMQESFIQVFRSLHNFRGESKLSTWIDRITVRVALHHIRKRQSTPTPVEEPEKLGASSPSHGSQVASREGVRRLYEALAQLPPASRIAFALHEIDGRSVAEVADIVGSAVSATKLRIWRARRALMKIAASDPVLAELLDEGQSSETGEGDQHEAQ